MRHFLIDTDTASDDAVALVMALRYPDVQVEAITIVAGNVPLDHGVQNALFTLEMCQKQVPVYRGMAAPLLQAPQTAQHVHGQDGMGEIGLPLTGRIAAPGHAVDVIRDTIHRHAHAITIVTLGPLTNLAMALLLEPELSQLVKECITMGGTGQGYGNVTPVAEYNIWADPEAASIVFHSGMPITMVGWDISRTSAVLTREEALALRNVGTPLARFCIDIQKNVEQFALHTTRLPGFDLPDPIAMAIALNPTVCLSAPRLFVSIEATSSQCRGQTIVDHLQITGKQPNANVVLSASRERFLAMLYAAVGEKTQLG